MYKFSIIIPIYNAEKYIEKTINSVLSQTFINYEVILIDDGSTDNSSRICKLYASKDCRIKYLSKKNEGVSVARNTGLKIATGIYIGFLDADDILEPDCLKKVYESIGEKDDKDLVTFDYYVNKKWIRKGCLLDENLLQKDNFERAFVIDNDKSVEYLQKLSTFVVWNKFFKREIINKYNICFKKGIYTSEDFLFCLEVWGVIKKAVYIQLPLYNYILNENSCIHLNAKRNMNAIIDNQKRVYEECGNIIENLSLPFFYLTPCINTIIYSTFSICESLFYNPSYSGDTFFMKIRKLDMILSSDFFCDLYRKYDFSDGYILSKACKLIMRKKRIKPSPLYIYLLFNIRNFSKKYRKTI